MASVTTDANGNRRIQFIAANGKRHSIFIGKRPLVETNYIKGKVEKLNAAVVSQGRIAIDRETAGWLAGLDVKLHAKLAKVGLVPALPEPDKTTLGPRIDEYIATRTDVTQDTLDHLRRAGRSLVDFFGADKPMTAITPGDADEFRLHLFEREPDRHGRPRRRAENTVASMCRKAKQMFRAAHRKRLIPENPFADLRGTSDRPNRDREHFVSREVAERVLEACPDARWRLIFALSRYGGLRCPSEHFRLRWGDVDWQRNRIRITSPKTKHQGKGVRWIPIFPELRPHLEAAWDEAEEGAEFLIARGAGDPRGKNLRTELGRIIERAHVKPWPKLFQNLRSTRETELQESFPAHVVCAWFGNTQTIAAKHYLQVTEAHFAKATGSVQKSVQHPVAGGISGAASESGNGDFCRTMPPGAAQCDSTSYPALVLGSGLKLWFSGEKSTRGLSPQRTGKKAAPNVAMLVDPSPENHPRYPVSVLSATLWAAT